MATEPVSSSLPIRVAAQTHSHPLSPLNAAEIKISSQLIQGLYPAGTKFIYKQITLHEPLKAQLAPYLDAEHASKPTAAIDRKAFVTYYIRNTVCRIISCFQVGLLIG